MAINSWRYYEGTTSAASFIQDMAKVLCTAVKTDAVLDVNGAVIKDQEVIINKNWDIVSPQPQKDQLNVMDWNSLTPAEFILKIENQLAQSTDTIIVKTTTTPKDLSLLTNVDDLGLEDDLSVASIDMYVELYKPTYLADNEKYNPECERQGVQPYNITTEIYQEYASNIGVSETNLKDQYQGVGGITVNTVDDLFPSAKLYATGSYGDQLGPHNQAAVMVNRINAVFGLTLPVDAGKITITPSMYATMKGTDVESFIASTTGVPAENFSKYSKLDITTSVTSVNYYGSMTYTNHIALTFHDTYETYVIPAGWTLELAEKEAVDATSIVLKVGTITKTLNKDYSFDVSTETFKTLTAISGQSRVLGETILTYNYKKEQTDISARKLLYNNHYIYVRMFDKIKDDFSGPVPDVVDALTGDVIYVNSHASEWSKLAWYQDFEEVMIDSLDSDVGSSDVTDGIINLPVDVPGLTSDTRIRFWINTNNDRALFVVMGNPSLDFSSNRHLISCSYLGQIESFDNSINDTAGNFALLTSSSTTPCDTKSVMKRTTLSDTELIGLGPLKAFPGIVLDAGKFFDSMGSYSITLSKDNGSGGSTVVGTLNKNDSFTITFSDDKTTADVTLLVSPDAGVNITLNYDYYIEKYDSVDGIIRDGFGNIVNIVYPDRWGKNTATGVTDITMFFTRSKAYFQKHHMMFTTTEEFMSKSLYGKSAYTNEYYADRVKITHGNDGPRGMLSDCLAIDTSSLYAFDELIVNRDFAKDATLPEETYIFFPITAPFSPFSGSPNATYGFAIKKSERYPEPVTDGDIVNAAMEELTVQVGDLQSLISDVVLPDTEDNGVTVTWVSNVITAIEIETI